MRRFEDEVVLVTGGASGIGAAVTRRVVSEGARALVFGRNEDALAAIAYEAPDRIDTVTVDLADPDAVAGALSVVSRRYDRIDHLVNNASGNVLGGIDDLSADVFGSAVDEMLTMVYATTRSALPLLRKSSVASIVNIGSISALGGERSHVAYSAGKAAIARLTDSLALDIGAEVRVNAVHPGFIAGTGMTAGAESYPQVIDPLIMYTPRGRLGQPDDVASVVAFLLSRDADFVNGAHVVVDGGMTASAGQPIIRL